MDTKVNQAGIWMGTGGGRELVAWGLSPPSSDNRLTFEPNKTQTCVSYWYY